jgi:hypothetical protein
MTNGHLTKKLLAAAKTQSGGQLASTAKSIMRRFPLSSHHLIYDQDRSKVAPGAWDTLLQAAVQTDTEKLAMLNTSRREMGLSPETSFGRAQQG